MTINLLHEIFEAQADIHPEAIAVSFRGHETSYAGLERSANRLARYLRARGVKRGTLVAILLSRSTGAYVAMLGVLKAGAAYVPLDPSYPRDRIAYVLDNSGASTLLTTTDFAGARLKFRGSIIKLDSAQREIDKEDSTRFPAGEVGVGPRDLCYVIYTSGSTGRPKGVQIEHHSASHLVLAEGGIYGAQPDDRVCQAAPLSFDLSVEEIWLALNSGSTLVPVPEEASHGGPDFQKFLEENHITVLSCVPTLLSMLEGDLPNLRTVILGGEACPDSVVSKWARPGRRIFNTYGPTETTVIATYAELLPGKKVTIGKAVPGYTVHVLDDSLKRVPQGAVGEICIGGEGVARGYVKLPTETRSKFVPDPFASGDEARVYRTGDLGLFNSEGNLEFMGRGDDQVKVRGYRVELAEIESAIMQQKNIRAAACAVREDVPGVQQLVAYVVTTDGSGVDERSVRSQLRDYLPAFMVPSLVEPIVALPMTPNGKLDRGALPPPAPRSKGLRSESRRPKNELEKRMANVWASVLQSQTVSPTDDFFLDLGGHSLLAARLVSELRTDPSFAGVSVADVYEYPTVESLAAAMDARNSRLLIQGEAPPQRPNRGRGHHGEPRRHLLAGLTQTLGLYFSFGFRAIEWVTPYLVFIVLLYSGYPLIVALEWAVVSAILVFPFLLAGALSAKWALLGRVKPGRHPLWSGYYLRWWFVQSLVSALPLDYLAGTPLLPAVYRMFGVRVGKNVHIESQNLRAFDLISIGDDASIDEDASLLGYTVEQGELVLGRIDIGRHCFVGTRSVMSVDTSLEDAARLGDLSLLPRGTSVPQGETWEGSPARPSPNQKVFVPPQPKHGLLNRITVPFVYGALVLSLPLLVLLAIAPGVALLFSVNAATQPLSYLFIVPFVGASFVLVIMAELVLLKWLVVGRVKPGTYPVHGGFFIKNWVVDQMHSLSLDLVAPIHATLYLAPWYRALGARVGRAVELSTATSTTPDLLEVGDESTVADEVSLGSPHVESGWMTVAPTTLGRRAFVGNSAVIPAGTTLGEGSLCGVLSVPPSEPQEAAKPGATWLGSPAIGLPRRQQSYSFPEQRTFRPTRRLKFARGAVELLRVTLPPAGFIVVTTAVLGATVALWGLLGLWPALLLVPVVYAAACGGVALAVVAAKWVAIRRYRPFEKPLWSFFIWRLELVNALYEFLVTPLFLDPLQGTPMLPGYLRLLGSRIGRGVYVHTTGFLEWDLVEIGDGAALNEDCVLQTHLFEDRVLKASHLKVGPDCDVGAYSVVLYGSEMEEGSQLDALSLLMKGERLPRDTSWLGIPARRSGDEIEVVEKAS